MNLILVAVSWVSWLMMMMTMRFGKQKISLLTIWNVSEGAFFGLDTERTARFDVNFLIEEVSLDDLTRTARSTRKCTWRVEFLPNHDESEINEKSTFYRELTAPN